MNAPQTEQYELFAKTDPTLVGRIDVHTHLLPGVDDGCTCVDDSLACARDLVRAGYSHAFCTPHVWPSLPDNNASEIRRRTADLQAALDAANIPLQLLPGGENNLMSAWPAIGRTPLDEIVTYNLAGRYVLFDFWADTPTQVRDGVEPAVRYLRNRGFELILAHPERITALQASPRTLDRLTEMGVHLQLNAWCLTEPRASAKRDMAERLLKDGRYFLIGSDLHRPSGMNIRTTGLGIAERLVGRPEVERLTITNPRLLL